MVSEELWHKVYDVIGVKAKSDTSTFGKAAEIVAKSLSDGKSVTIRVGGEFVTFYLEGNEVKIRDGM